MKVKYSRENKNFTNLTLNKEYVANDVVKLKQGNITKIQVEDDYGKKYYFDETYFDKLNY